MLNGIPLGTYRAYTRIVCFGGEIVSDMHVPMAYSLRGTYVL